MYTVGPPILQLRQDQMTCLFWKLPSVFTAHWLNVKKNRFWRNFQKRQVIWSCLWSQDQMTCLFWKLPSKPAFFHVQQMCSENWWEFQKGQVIWSCCHCNIKINKCTCIRPRRLSIVASTMHTVGTVDPPILLTVPARSNDLPFLEIASIHCAMVEHEKKPVLMGRKPVHLILLPL